MTPAKVLKWLQDLGVAPDNQSVAIAALAISIQDWNRELRRSQRRQLPPDEPIYTEDLH